MLKTQKSSTRSILGAPSQLNQSSRKGKRAWRKNVDIEDVEKGLENIRAEERATGSVFTILFVVHLAHSTCFRTALQKVQDVDLFQVDLKGDDNSTSNSSFGAPLISMLFEVRKSLPRYSSAQLTSAKILAQRSAVPAVISRISASKKRKPILGHEEKERLLRIAKRSRNGPLNRIMDGLSEAVKESGSYDPWAPGPPQEILKDGLETVQVPVVKVFHFPFLRLYWFYDLTRLQPGRSRETLLKYQPLWNLTKGHRITLPQTHITNFYSKLPP